MEPGVARVVRAGERLSEALRKDFNAETDPSMRVVLNAAWEAAARETVGARNLSGVGAVQLVDCLDRRVVVYIKISREKRDIRLNLRQSRALSLQPVRGWGRVYTR